MDRTTPYLLYVLHPYMIEGRVTLGDAQKSIFKKNKDNYKKVLICPKKHVSLQRI